eukprot:1161815-Pelagomonas_calceolata.AAC.17
MTSAWLDQGGWQDSLIVHRMTRNTQPAVCLLGSVTCAAVSLARHGHTRVRAGCYNGTNEVRMMCRLLALHDHRQKRCLPCMIAGVIAAETRTAAATARAESPVSQQHAAPAHSRNGIQQTNAWSERDAVHTKTHNIHTQTHTQVRAHTQRFLDDLRRALHHRLIASTPRGLRVRYTQHSAHALEVGAEVVAVQDCGGDRAIGAAGHI